MKSQSGKAMFALTTFAVGWLTVVGVAQQTAKSTSAAKSAKGPVQEITLPEYPVELPPGPNLQAFQQHCLLCHTARYVTMQPNFSRAVWEKEVKKMVDVYGAPISAEEQPKIVEYLVAIKGPSESK
jgi:cytochrome c5